VRGVPPGRPDPGHGHRGRAGAHLGGPPAEGAPRPRDRRPQVLLAPCARRPMTRCTLVGRACWSYLGRAVCALTGTMRYGPALANMHLPCCCTLLQRGIVTLAPAATLQQRVYTRAVPAPSGPTGRRARAERGQVRGPQGPGDGAVVLGERLLPGHCRRQRHQALGARPAAACSEVRGARPRCAGSLCARTWGPALLACGARAGRTANARRTWRRRLNAYQPSLTLNLPPPRGAQDLRKLKNFRTLDLAAGAAGAAVAFDRSGLFLAAGGADVTVAGVKQDCRRRRARALACTGACRLARSRKAQGSPGPCLLQTRSRWGSVCAAPACPACTWQAGPTMLRRRKARTKNGRSKGGALSPQRARPWWTC